MPGTAPFTETIEFGRPVAEVGIVPHHRVQLTLDDLGDDRTRLIIHGTAPLSVRRAFAELWD